ncbi:MAG: TetR/AcrR family transcriptional regulator [Rhodocyclaceae bacterium]|nr:TetR/AcrR family transcriptional regulator [Rhodocyclaceae bacterium]
MNSTRAAIIEAADRLFYQRGYRDTSFADIAAAVGLSRGNFYHHFKSKDAILDGVIALRRQKTGELLAQWSAESADPAGRIRSFIHILAVNRDPILEHGCPVGSLCVELAKADHEALADAAAIFTMFRDWLRAQFEALGRADDADELAMHLLARSQGAATLASAFHDRSFLDREIESLETWLAHCLGDRPEPQTQGAHPCSSSC